MKYLKRFNYLSDYELFKRSVDWITPNVSAIEDTGEIKVNPIRKVISFKIDNPEGMYTDFQAYERMTWDEWVNSDFNTDGYIIEDDFVVDTWSGNIVSINDEKQMKYNIIIKDFNYSLSQPIR